MSPRAAWRLETLGFTKVYDYVAGKADWAAAGLPIEGKLAAIPGAGDVARTDVPTCRLTDLVGDVKRHVAASRHRFCVVTNEAGIILGRLGPRALREADPQAEAQAVMESGPTTTRVDERAMSVAARLREHGVASILITTSDGRLVGAFYRDDFHEDNQPSVAG